MGRQICCKLQEELMGGVVGKDPKFVFYTRAVPWSDTFDHSGEERRILEASSQNLMNLLVRMKDVAVHLLSTRLYLRQNRHKGEARRRFIPLLSAKPLSIN